MEHNAYYDVYGSVHLIALDQYSHITYKEERDYITMELQSWSDNGRDLTVYLDKRLYTKEGELKPALLSLDEESYKALSEHREVCVNALNMGVRVSTEADLAFYDRCLDAYEGHNKQPKVTYQELAGSYSFDDAELEDV